MYSSDLLLSWVSSCSPSLPSPHFLLQIYRNPMVQGSILQKSNAARLSLDVRAKSAFLHCIIGTFLLRPNELPFDDFSFWVKYYAGEGECAFSEKSLRSLEGNLI